MKNSIQTSGQSSIAFEKPGILSKNLKTLMSCNYPTVQYFLLKLGTLCLLTNVYKRMCGIFLKIPGFYTLFFYIFYIFTITQDLDKIKKNLEHPLVDIIN